MKDIYVRETSSTFKIEIENNVEFWVGFISTRTCQERGMGILHADLI